MFLLIFVSYTLVFLINYELKHGISDFQRYKF